jgi:CYTH domain-containing protein
MMAREIERKFLVKGEGWRIGRGTLMRQGYLNLAKERTVRVRMVADQGTLAVKGITVGASRLEFEYEIPVKDADVMLTELCARPLIEKQRFVVEYGGLTWEIDEFMGENAGLVVAEVELQSEDQAFERPPWLGEEVTEDPRYFNSNLSRTPYSEWGAGQD